MNNENKNPNVEEELKKQSQEAAEMEVKLLQDFLQSTERK